MSDIRTLMTGIALGESPRWRDGRLWFSDWGAGKIFAVDPDGTSEVMVEVPAFPFCFDWLPDGRMVITGGETGLLRREPDGSLVPHADLRTVSTFANNEVITDRHGRAYVNNVGFQFPGGEFAPGLIALVTADGEVSTVANDVAFPNGMALTADGSTLVVAESYAARLTAFDVEPGGGLTNRRVWAELHDEAAPDGICFDASGALWYADVPNRECVLVEEGGTVRQRIKLELGCFSCALGGPEGTTLYIVAADWSDPEMIAHQTGILAAVEL